VIVSLDPGTKHAGIAVWEDDELTAAWLVRGTGWLATAQQVLLDLEDRFPACILVEFDLVMEKPQIYHQAKQKGEQASLIELALMVGAVAGMSRLHPRRVTTYQPAAWKRQIPKNVMVERVRSRLMSEECERVVLPAKSLQHNVWDAIGIGLHHLKRRTTTT